MIVSFFIEREGAGAGTSAGSGWPKNIFTTFILKDVSGVSQCVRFAAALMQFPSE